MNNKNYKLLIGIIIGIIISGSVVYAAETLIESIQIHYDNSVSGGTYETVQQAIDELYEKSGLLKEKWIDPILNGADPVLEVENSTKKLIPVIIDSDGTVKYANLYTKWYNYSEKRWANAVILVDNPSTAYKTGDIIEEKDIESYFVWIPRYKYKIWDLGNYTNSITANTLANTNYETSASKLFGNAKIIDIVFENALTSKSTTQAVGSYYTHPAFSLGYKELNGIWVGKFETGYNQNSEIGKSININGWTSANASVAETETYEITDRKLSSKIIVKPNVFSWRNNSVKTYFLSSFKYDRTLESHMMKNIEWGAVAYLSHSIYGIGTKINVNNNSEYKTGYSAQANTDQSSYPGTSGSAMSGLTKLYNTTTGYLASTTGNITGVYDMSGGTHEYVAAFVNKKAGSSGLLITDLEGTFKNYVDIYNMNISSTSYNYRILGDATGEMGPFYQYYEKNGSLYNHNIWYSNYSHMISAEYPWFNRGGDYNHGIFSGQFYFGYSTGDGRQNYSSRLVLATK